jgi:hypothetical protein
MSAGDILDASERRGTQSLMEYALLARSAWPLLSRTVFSRLASANAPAQ